MDQMNSSFFNKALSIVENAGVLGSRLLDDGSRIIGHVPHVAEEAYLHELFAPLTESQIELLQRDIVRCSIPDPYRQFLGLYNGATFFSCELCLNGMRRDFSRMGDACRQPFGLELGNVLGRPRDARGNEFFIGGYRKDGSLLYLKSGQAFRCGRSSVRPLNAWGSLSEMINNEVSRLSEHFDDKGRRIDISRSILP